MEKYFLSLLCLILYASVFNSLSAQNEGMQRRTAPPGAMQQQFQLAGKVTGKVLDAQSNQPIEYANVVIYRWKDSTVANGTVTNAEGNFTVDRIMNGRYFMKISYIGYATKRFDSLIVRPGSSSYDYPSIKLNPKNVNMNEVVVKSERDVANFNLDKKVYNVDKNLANSGGTAVDVVQNIPAVQVDADGGVSVRGNTNITVLVDGRPAQLAGFSGSDVLAQIPASQIESIELVTNPSARYDPEGTGGIINVILKKKSNLGVNASLMANAGTKGRYSSSINGNLRGDGFNAFASYDARFFNMTGSGSTLRNSNFNGITGVLNQTSSSKNNNNNHNINLGGDYYFGEKEFVSLSGSFRFGRFGSNNLNTNKDYNSANTLTSYYDRSSESDRDNNSGNYTLSYKKTWENRVQELTGDIMYSQSSMDNVSDITQTYYSTGFGYLAAPSLQKTMSDNTNKMFLTQANYIQPLGIWGRFEGGFRSMIRDLAMTSNYLAWNYGLNTWGKSSTLIDDEYDYKEQVHAAYAIYSNSFGKFSFQFGVRAEQAIIDGHSPINPLNKFSTDYFEVYPTGHLRYSLGEFDEIQLSYSKRIDRPQNRQLNPYEDRTDSLNIVKGNPNLRPQFYNSFELGYTTLLSKTALVTNLFYRINNNLISTISTLLPNGVTYSTFQNVSSGSSYGTEFIVSQPVGDWWRLNATFSIFNTRVEDSGTLGGSRESNSWRTMLNSQMTLSEGFVLQSMIFYNSPSIMLMMGGFGGGGGFRGGGGGGGDFGGGMFFGGAATQTKMKELVWMDLMLRKDFFDGQLSATLRISDIFNTRKFDTETTASNFTAISKRLMDSRTVNLGITYRINSKSRMMDQERQRRIEDGYDEL
ncbi:MAG: Outer membrane receptor protein [Ignavibacteria bacterium]|nr:MAG: Outer membrane receptor protein [Ignavibacteria bacterium]KAF0161092.1 MAG: Outer membrane receptor protein [Ignavibacteria bacterium]